MAHIVLHAGMPKTGSTSIQTWLRAHADALRQTHHTTILRDATTLRDTERTTRVAFEPFDTGMSVTTVSFLMQYAVARDESERSELMALAQEFIDALDHAASRFQTVVLTSEAFAYLFAAGDEPFLRGLDKLAQRHTVRVAYYVRPQHSALEARWRQWGFRTGMNPTAWVLEQAAQLRYAETVSRVRELAPGIAFDVRPFRADLLAEGNVVVDFVREIPRDRRSAGRVRNEGEPWPAARLRQLVGQRASFASR